MMNNIFEYLIFIITILVCIVIGIIGTFINFAIMMFFRVVYLFSRNKAHDMIARKPKYNIVNTISII